jgi:hypothetical protein
MNRNLAVFGIAAILLAQPQKAPTAYSDTPILPGSPWRVHDDARPRPPIVTPVFRQPSRRPTPWFYSMAPA